MPLLLLAIACLFVVTLGYIGLCAAQPFGPCRACRGLGFQTKTDRRGRTKRGKDCRRCKTTGQRIRTGHHLLNLWREIYRASTR
ncbi:hypothetical protein [Peterkaempfera sp. SMS 1(5)a]|uniref:hypothetical protein n=1 Tax=Peterkaempfera podocarpi TaxID=3232308 RepID=UPI00366DB850